MSLSQVRRFGKLVSNENLIYPSDTIEENNALLGQMRVTHNPELWRSLNPLQVIVTQICLPHYSGLKLDHRCVWFTIL